VFVPPGIRVYAENKVLFSILCRMWVAFVAAGGLLALAQNAAMPYHKQMQWMTYAVDHPLNNRWELHFDGSWREMTSSDWVQWQVRPGVNYRLHENVDLQATYAYFKSNPAGLEWDLKSFPENRLHQQVRVRHRAGGVAFRHRVRAEQRWFGAEFERKGLDPDWMQHRFRYLVGGTIPLANRMERGTVAYLNVYEEFMLRAKNAGVSAFEQNRVYAGVGVRPYGEWSIETGVFYQRVQPILGGRMEDNFVLHTTVRSTLPFGLLGNR
jgi:hypothetical protein